jgi:hypothetical protein
MSADLMRNHSLQEAPDSAVVLGSGSEQLIFTSFFILSLRKNKQAT